MELKKVLTISLLIGVGLAVLCILAKFQKGYTVLLFALPALFGVLLFVEAASTEKFKGAWAGENKARKWLKVIGAFLLAALSFGAFLIVMLLVGIITRAYRISM